MGPAAVGGMIESLDNRWSISDVPFLIRMAIGYVVACVLGGVSVSTWYWVTGKAAGGWLFRNFPDAVLFFTLLALVFCLPSFLLLRVLSYYFGWQTRSGYALIWAVSGSLVFLILAPGPRSLGADLLNMLFATALPGAIIGSLYFSMERPGQKGRR